MFYHVWSHLTMLLPVYLSSHGRRAQHKKHHIVRDIVTTENPLPWLRLPSVSSFAGKRPVDLHHCDDIHQTTIPLKGTEAHMHKLG